jgi:Mg2+ and Co2+ transporter CorA
MKIFTNILIFVAIALIIVNVFTIDFNKPLEGNSMVALIGIVAAICAVLILLIFRMSKKIEQNLKN